MWFGKNALMQLKKYPSKSNLGGDYAPNAKVNF